MPIYEYRCQGCGKIVEFLHKKADSKKKPSCPECGSKDVERIISAPGMVKVEWRTSSSSATSSNTCCGRSEPCDTPPCADDDTCKRTND